MRMLLLVPLLLGLGAGAARGEGRSDPGLRVETGMHTGAVSSLAVEPGGRLLATGSEDATVRIWDLSSYALVRTLRPPSYGPNSEGSLYALAWSPDGRTLAAAGLTQFYDLASGSSSSVYLFDAGSGRMRRRLPGPPGTYGSATAETIMDLSFSPDGSRVATARIWGTANVFMAQGGVRLPWEPQLAGSDVLVGSVERVYTVDYDPRGRLLVSSLDGFLRLYEPALNLLAETRLSQDRPLFRARFSPDGTRIAVGYRDQAQVDVLSGEDLGVLYHADVAGIGGGDLRNVAWSADGKRLCAGGSGSSAVGVGAILGPGRGPVIRCWEDGGRGAYRDLPAGGRRLRDLRALPQGGMAFATDDPAWGVLGADGRLLHLRQGDLIGVRDRPGALLVDRSGNRVGFPYGPAAGGRFSVSERVLTSGAADRQLLAPRTAAAGLQVSGWHDGMDGAGVKLNGAALFGDVPCYSLAISADGAVLYFGTHRELRAYDRAGKNRYMVTVPAAVWAVNTSADGRLLVAALADGTVRWHRAADGVELLALFPHPDRRRWVAWTPAGAYDTSIGGEELVGWQVNPDSVQAAEFFPAALFRKQFYRPQTVATSLAAAVAPPLPSAAAAPAAVAPAAPPKLAALRPSLPPLVSILSPADGAEVPTAAARVQVQLRSPSGQPITGVRVLVDGREVARTRGVVDLGEEPGGQRGAQRTLSVPLPPGESTVAVLAETAQGAGPPAVLRLRRARQPDFAIQPALYLLAVGVSQYPRPDLRLNYAAKDARDLAAAFLQQKGRLYRQAEARVLLDGDATREHVLDGLEWLRRQTTAKDVAVLFLAGHGINDPASGQYYYLPYDADPDRVLSTMLAGTAVQAALSSLPGKVLVFLDTCHAGNLYPGRSLRGGADVTRFVNELASTEQGTGRITLNMLDLYLSERVKELTRGTQTPASARPSTVADFPVAVLGPP